jgi:hypothetical protein
MFAGQKAIIDNVGINSAAFRGFSNHNMWELKPKDNYGIL